MIIGDTEIKNMFVGNTQVKKAFNLEQLVWSQTPKIGDYVYKDLTYSTQYISSKEVAGIIFYTLGNQTFILHPEEMGIRQYSFGMLFGTIGNTVPDGFFNEFKEYENFDDAKDEVVNQNGKLEVLKKVYEETWKSKTFDGFNPYDLWGWGKPFKSQFTYNSITVNYTPLSVAAWSKILITGDTSVLDLINTKISKLGGEASPISSDSPYCTSTYYNYTSTSPELCWGFDIADYYDTWDFSGITISTTDDFARVRAMGFVNSANLTRAQ